MTAPIKILCVDDDPDIRTIAVMALGLDLGIQVHAASSGSEALAVLRSDEWRPDAVLLDVMMPGMDGLATLAAIRSLGGFEDLPVIFMTARARKEDLDSYRRQGATGVIVKPFDPLHLAEDVRSLIESNR